MINALLSLTLILTPLRIDSVYEEIRITDKLVLKAEYIDAGVTLEREGMLLSIEDFSIVQSEFLSVEQAWESRIKSLNEAHTSELIQFQKQCESEYKFIQNSLRLQESKVDLLEKSLSDARSNARIYKWIAISVGVLSAGSITYILTRR